MDQLCGDLSSRVQGLNLFGRVRRNRNLAKEKKKKGDVSAYILSPALTQIRVHGIRIKRLITVSMDSPVDYRRAFRPLD